MAPGRLKKRRYFLRAGKWENLVSLAWSHCTAALMHGCCQCSEVSLFSWRRSSLCVFSMALGKVGSKNLQCAGLWKAIQTWFDFLSTAVTWAQYFWVSEILALPFSVDNPSLNFSFWWHFVISWYLADFLSETCIRKLYPLPIQPPRWNLQQVHQNPAHPHGTHAHHTTKFLYVEHGECWRARVHGFWSGYTQS